MLILATIPPEFFINLLTGWRQCTHGTICLNFVFKRLPHKNDRWDDFQCAMQLPVSESLLLTSEQHNLLCTNLKRKKFGAISFVSWNLFYVFRPLFVSEGHAGHTCQRPSTVGAAEKEAYREIIKLVQGCMDLKRKWSKIYILLTSRICAAIRYFLIRTSRKNTTTSKSSLLCSFIGPAKPGRPWSSPRVWFLPLFLLGRSSSAQRQTDL